MDLLEFYGLKEDPFKLTPDPEYFFPSPCHNDALLSMEYTIQQREGFCLVSGEPGTGKTTILNVFMKKWKDSAEIALILTPRLSSEEFLTTVLDDLNVTIASKGKSAMLRTFRNFLLDRSTQKRPVIIIVDEAQNLPTETLEETRLLSNLETEKEKLLQIILIGQPEIEKRLNTRQLRQLNQRISVRVNLYPFSIDRTREYINYRLIKAGKGHLRLDEKSLKAIHNFSNGIPRLINLVTTRAIMAAYIERENTIFTRHVNYAIKHLRGGEGEGNRGAGYRPSYLILLTAAVLFMIAVFLGYYLLRK